jgi:hypothetical protein
VTLSDVKVYVLTTVSLLVMSLMLLGDVVGMNGRIGLAGLLRRPCR